MSFAQHKAGVSCQVSGALFRDTTNRRAHPHSHVNDERHSGPGTTDGKRADRRP
jgi:hypothetical protein